MISSALVYDTSLALIKKDKRGRAFSCEEYNSISALVNLELYNMYISKYEQGMSVTDALLHLKIRNIALTLDDGQAWLPGRADRILGSPWITYPWGTITATASADVKGYPDLKVKVTSPNHGLKDGAVITATGLSAHTITAKPIFFIDKNTFWVNVNYTAADTLTDAAWTLDASSYKEVDLVTENELALRWADGLTKPSIHNAVAVLDMGSPEIWIDSEAIQGYLPSGHSFAAYGAGAYAAVVIDDTPTNNAPAEALPFELKTGDLITIWGGTDGAGTARNGYNGTWRVVRVPRTGPTDDDEVFYLPDLLFGVANNPTFAFLKVYNRKRINVYPDTIPSVNINYSIRPATPLLDFYVDANYVINYLAQSQNEVDIADGEEYRDGTVGPVTVNSHTQDWEWDEDMLPEIVYRILLKAGINLENMNITQVAAQLQTKEESQI